MTFSYFGGKRSSSSSRSTSSSFQPVTVPGLAMLPRRRSRRSVPGREPLHQALGEIDQRVITCAHDQNPVPRLRLAQERSADIGPLLDVLGGSLALLNLLHEPVRSAISLDRPALVDRVRKIQTVTGRHSFSKCVREFLAHLRQRTITMRLEHDQQPPGMRAKGRQRRRNLVGIVSKIVDDGYSGSLAYSLQPAPQSFKPAKRGCGVSDCHAKCPRRCNRRERVRGVVASGNLQLHIVAFSLCLDGEAGAIRPQLQ